MRALVSQLPTPTLNYPCYCTPILSSMPAPPAQLAVALTSTFSAHTSLILWDLTGVYSAQLCQCFYFLLTKNLQIPHNTLKFQLVLLPLNQNPSLGSLLESNNLLINHIPQNCTISCAELGTQGIKNNQKKKKKKGEEGGTDCWMNKILFFQNLTTTSGWPGLLGIIRKDKSEDSLLMLSIHWASASPLIN